MLSSGADRNALVARAAAPAVAWSRGGGPLDRLAAAAPALAAALGDDADALGQPDSITPAALLRSADATGEDHLAAWYRAARRGRQMIAARLLTGEIDAAEAGLAYSDLADAALTGIMRMCETDFVSAHGRVTDGRHAVVAIGRLGARELTFNSDLDLLLLYDYDDRAEMSDGAQPLPACQYYVRLTQRLIAALSCNFGDGPLFAVDFRLRPWGKKGPIATRITSLRDYFATEAWTFEAMALTRARVVTGTAGFAAQAEAALHQAIAAVRDRADVRADALRMRRIVQREKASRRVWDIKCVAGGLMDIDFIVHTLAIEHVDAFGDAPMHDMRAALRTLSRAGVLPRAEAVMLTWALDLYRVAIQHLRAASPTSCNAREMPEALAAVMARASGSADIREFEQRLREAQRAVRLILDATLGKGQRDGARKAA
jgi:glutamate-ammonia-ligase adenylyltransferase